MIRNSSFKAGILALAAGFLSSIALAQAPADAPPAAPPAAAPPVAAPPAAAAPAAPAPAAAAPAEAAELSGMAAWNAIVGNTISGKKEGDDYDYCVKADGSIVWLDDGDIETGKWALEGQKVCITFPDEDKECYKVDLKGDIVVFLDDDGSGFRGTLAKGNPKKL